MQQDSVFNIEIHGVPYRTVNHKTTALIIAGQLAERIKDGVRIIQVNQSKLNQYEEPTNKTMENFAAAEGKTNK